MPDKIHYELTDRSKVDEDGTTLYQIRYTGTGLLGGWMPSTHWGAGEVPYLTRGAYLSQWAEISGFSQLRDKATVFGGRITGQSTLSGGVVLEGSATSIHNSNLSGNVTVKSDVEIFNTEIHGDERIPSGARIHKTSDYMSIIHIGSEDVDIMLVRTEFGYHLNVGCWHGPLEELMDEVQLRREQDWNNVSETIKDLWEAQYKAFIPLAESYIAIWKEEDKENGTN